MLRAAIAKDVQLLLRDRGALMSLFLLPLIFVAVFGNMFGADGSEGQPREIVVSVPEGHPVGQAIVAALDDSGVFVTKAEVSPERVRQLVADEEADVGLIVPADFDPAAGRPAELVIDLAQPIQFRGPLQGAITGIVGRALAGGAPVDAAPIIDARSPPGLKPPLELVDGFQVSVPGNSVLFGFFLALTVALSFVEERKSGTWRRLLAAPVRRPVVLLAKLVPFFLVGLIQMGFLFGLGALAFGMSVAGSFTALVLLTCAVVFCATALGLLIASFGGTEKQVGGIGSICILVMGLLGGAMVPRLIMPETMQQIGLLTPHAWALEGYYDVLIREGTTVRDVLPSILAVTGFGVVFSAIGALIFRFER
jgi:ABC-2 type transport system permease protein